MHWTAAAIAAAVGGRLDGPDVDIDGASFDSRSVSPGQLFVPVVAERDGHDFVAGAVAAGASAYLSSRGALGVPATAIVVDDTSVAFARLGAAARNRLPDLVVGVTGSVGKTTVKDLCASVLARRWVTTANVRSFNNELGLPATLVNAQDGTEATVVEMGMRGFGHIAELCRIARPTVGVITQLGAAHVEFVGDLDGVARAKGELVEALPPSGLAVLNADQPLARSLAERTTARVLTYGLDGGEVRASRVLLDDLARPRFVLSSAWGDVEVAMGASGRHMALNAVAAAAVALGLGVGLEDVADGLARAALSPWRMEVGTAPSGAVVVNDAYNANPTSMLAALEATAAMAGAGRRVAVLGVMAELGAGTADAHLEVAEHARRLGFTVVAVATDAYGIEPVTDPAAALLALGGLGAGDVVLVKGSRVAGLERVVAALTGGVGSAKADPGWV